MLLVYMLSTPYWDYVTKFKREDVFTKLDNRIFSVDKKLFASAFRYYVQKSKGTCGQVMNTDIDNTDFVQMLEDLRPGKSTRVLKKAKQFLKAMSKLSQSRVKLVPIETVACTTATIKQELRFLDVNIDDVEPWTMFQGIHHSRSCSPTESYYVLLEQD